MMIKPPFSTTFGILPNTYIDRGIAQDEIIEEFSNEFSPNLVYMLTGIRGSGKTATLTAIANHFRNQSDWVVVDAGPKENMLENVAGAIYEKGKAKRLFLKGEFSFSFRGVGFSLQGAEPISNIMSLLDKMLTYLESKGKKILITVDEVENSPSMKSFIEAYSSLLREGHPVRLLMTGLYERVMSLQDNGSLTFLYRAPKVHLGPLPINAIAAGYQEYLKVGEERAIDLAKLTKGYAYAYQLLGYLLYKKENRVLDNDLLVSFDSYLATNVYDKIYQGLSPSERKIVLAIKGDGSIKVSIIKDAIDMGDKHFGVYRDRLIKMGVLSSPGYGLVEFALPRFSSFLKTR